MMPDAFKQLSLCYAIIATHYCVKILSSFCFFLFLILHLLGTTTLRSTQQAHTHVPVTNTL